MPATLFRPEYVEHAAKLAAFGATDAEIAAFFEVNVSTLAKWRIKHPAFDDALKAGKEAADNRVERSLYARAIGYTFDSEKVFNHQGEVVRAPVVEHVPPDVTAQIFWLKNRRPDLWRDVKRIEVGKVESLHEEQARMIAETYLESAKRTAAAALSESGAASVSEASDPVHAGVPPGLPPG